MRVRDGVMVLMALVVVGLGVVPAEGSLGGASAAYTLTWAPPPCGGDGHTCVTQTLVNTGAHQYLRLNRAEDFRLVLPKTGPLVGGISIGGGHNVTLIGGEIDLTPGCASDSAVCHGINISRGSLSTGEVFIEGVLIKNPDTTLVRYTGDGVDVNTAATSNVTLENMRVQGIVGCDYNGSPAHADVFQPYGANGAHLDVDHLTGTTAYQGMQVNPGTAVPASGTYKNVNINVLPNSHTGCTQPEKFGWWLAKKCTTYPITLSSVYEQEPNGSLAQHAVWPKFNTTGCAEQYSNGVATWPTVAKISGGIINGRPPSGDFVPPGVAGIGYVSPGYGTTPTPTPTAAPR